MLAKRLARNIFGFSQNSPNALWVLAPNEKETYLKKLEENAYVNYKTYPTLPHQDPTSPQYIQSQLDEYHEKTDIQQYNRVIDQFKHDMKLQRQIWNAIAKLDRPYKKGIPGVDTDLDPNGPTKPELAYLGFPRRDSSTEQAQTFANQDRFVAQAIWHPKQQLSNIIQWEKQRLNRPVTRDYNHSKGYKYDVPVKPEQKYEWVSDRLGHPEFMGTPLERLLRLEKDLYHPVFIDQPFVKMPNHHPSSSLNFQQGEVIYENTRVLEWIRAFQLGNVALLSYFGIFIPLNIAFKTNLTLDKADQLWIGEQALYSPFGFDILRLFTPISSLGVYYILYGTMKVITQFAQQYALKVSYSKDRELLFVKRVTNFGTVEEVVYETAHLQILPPRQRTGVQDLSSQDADGLWRVTCLNTQQNLLLYNDNVFWNKKLKSQFLGSKLNFWDKSYYGYNRKQQKQQDDKLRQQILNSFNQEALPGK